METQVAPDVGQLDVYKVHHHCSSYSTNSAWLDATRPTIAIISTGDGNAYHHPAEDCVTRLHEAGVEKLYWTEEGAGAKPEAGIDVVAGDIRIEVAPGDPFYTVTYKGSAPETYTIKAAQTDTTKTKPPPLTQATPSTKYAWSKRSSVYHDANCPDVKKILAENLVESDQAPPDKAPAACVKQSK